MNGLEARSTWQAGRLSNAAATPSHELAFLRRYRYKRVCIPTGGLVMSEVARNIGWAVVFSFIGGVVGIALVLVSSFILPRLIERMTPNIDEEKEIARGNTAVAEYFGRIAAASIIGMSIVVAAAVLGGIIAALY
jgi:hypothetical protein